MRSPKKDTSFRRGTYFGLYPQDPRATIQELLVPVRGEGSWPFQGCGRDGTEWRIFEYFTYLLGNLLSAIYNPRGQKCVTLCMRYYLAIPNI